MQPTADRSDFHPPQEPAAVQSFGIAVVAHVLLVAALAWGINWQRQPDRAAVEAELWSSLPQEAAPPPPPAPMVTAPAPVPVPAPVPAPVPVPPPPPAPRQVVEPPAPVAPKPPDINIEREKKRREALLKKQQEEAEKKKVAAQKADEARKERAEQQAKAAQDAREAKEKATRDKAKQLAESKRLEALREDNLKRMLASAAGTGSAESQGSAKQSTGPSADYAGRIRARVKPNIVFAEDVPGNPSAEVEVRMAPDGTIVGKKLVKASGVASWDDAVLRALDRTEVLPRDTDGRVHSPLIIAFKPKG